MRAGRSKIGGSTQQRHGFYVADQREYFDELITTDWAAYRDPRWDRIRRWEVARLFDLVRPVRVLDIGCGCGFHDVLMAEMPGVSEVVAIDYSAKSVETANREFPHPRVSRWNADLFGDQAADLGVFDLVVSFQVIEHVPDAAAFLAACVERLGPGGRVAAFTPNRERLNNRLRRLVGKPLALEDPQHFQELTVSELKEIGRSVGLEPVSSFAYSMSVFLPRLGQVIPQRIGFRASRLVEPLADRFALVMERSVDSSIS